MLKSERINFLAKKVAPNPLEATYWIDLTEDPQGTVWKWYDPEDNIWKVLLLGNQEGTLDAYTKAESDRIFATNQSVEDLVDIINSKQDQLVSEVNIKTINGTSILGSGDISIDRGLNQNQVQDLIDESTKDFITVDETHEYVQEEIAKLKLVVLDKTKLPESIYNLIFNEEVDYSAIEEDLLTTENQLLYIDPDNGMYRLSYNQVTNQIDYVYTTIVQGKVIEQSNSLDDEGLHQNYTISKDIVLYTDNQHDGITIQCEKNGINREVTLFSRGDGESYLSDDGQYKVIGAINLYTSMDRLPDKLGVLLDNTAITLDNFNDAKTYLTELGEPVYLLLTDKYNPTEKEYSTIEGNQLHTFYYDNEEDCIYIVEYINPLHQIYSNDNPLGNVVEITKISNTAQVISRRINRGIYSDSQGFNIQVEDNTTDSSTDPNGTTVRRHLNVITEGNGKDVLFNDGEYRNLQDSIDFSNYLAKDNTEPYTPTGPYNPATKKYVDDAILDLIDSAPSDLDTLRELANAINNDPNFSTTIFNLINELNSKVDDLENQSGSTGDSIQQIIEDITNIEGDIVDINNSITNIENQLGGDGGGTSITETITNIQNNITNIEGDVTDIKQDITEINNELNSKFELPDGGTTGQVLKKQEDGSVAWADDEVGESGGTNVQWQSDLTAGEVIGTLTINGNANVLYAPESNTDPVTPSTPGLMTPEDKEKLDGIAEGADDVKFAQVLTGGTKIGTITINGTATDIYAPAGSSGEEGSTVSYTPIVTSGTKIGTLTIDGAGYDLFAPEVNIEDATQDNAGLMTPEDKEKLDGIAAGADNVEWSSSLSTGTAIGTLKINDTSYTIYAPTATTSTPYELPIATSTVLGGVKSVTTGTTANRDYNVEVNADGTMKVNVPWVEYNPGESYEVQVPTYKQFILSPQDTEGRVRSATVEGTPKLLFFSVMPIHDYISDEYGDGQGDTTYVFALNSDYDRWILSVPNQGIKEYGIDGFLRTDYEYNHSGNSVTFSVVDGKTPINDNTVGGVIDLCYVICEIPKSVEAVIQEYTENPYTLPAATSNTLGGIKVGSGLSISGDGTLSSTATGSSDYELPAATSTTLGGVKIGEGINVTSDGTISVTNSGSGSEYVLPIASNTVLGGVKIGNGIDIDDTGTISVGTPLSTQYVSSKCNIISQGRNTTNTYSYEAELSTPFKSYSVTVGGYTGKIRSAYLSLNLNTTVGNISMDLDITQPVIYSQSSDFSRHFNQFIWGGNPTGEPGLFSTFVLLNKSNMYIDLTINDVTYNNKTYKINSITSANVYFSVERYKV